MLVDFSIAYSRVKNSLASAIFLYIELPSKRGSSVIYDKDKRTNLEADEIKLN